MSQDVDISFFGRVDVDFSKVEREIEKIEKLLRDSMESSMEDVIDQIQDGFQRITSSAKDAAPQIAEVANQSERAAKRAEELANKAKEASDEIEKLGDSAEKLGGKLPKSIDIMPQVEILTKGAQRQATSVVEKAGDAYLEFSKQMQKIRPLLNGEDFSYQEAFEKIQKISEQTGKKSEEIAEGFYQSLKSGRSGQESFELVETAAKMATAGLLGTTEALTMLTDAMEICRNSNLSAVEISDQLIAAQESGGLSVAELSGEFRNLAQAAQESGIPLQELIAAATALAAGNMTTSESVEVLRELILAIAEPTEEAYQLAEQLGISFGKQALETQGLAKVLDALRLTAAGSGEAMTRLLGDVDAVRTAAALTGEQAEIFSSSLDAINGSAGKTEEVFMIVSGEPSMQFQKAMNGLGTQLIRLGDVLSPILEYIAELFSVFSKIPPKAFAIVAVLVILSGAFVSIFNTINTVLIATGLASQAFMGLNVTWSQTAAILIGVAMAIAAVIALFAILSGKSEDAANSVSRTMENTQNQLEQRVDDSQQRVQRRLVKTNPTNRYAIGTLSAPRGTAWVGERGPELVEFSGGERVHTATQSAALAAMAGGGQSVQVTNYNRIDASNLAQVGRLIELLNGERQSMRMGYAGR